MRWVGREVAEMILVVYLVMMLALLAAFVVGSRISRRPERSAAAVPPPPQMAHPALSEAGGGVDVVDDDAELAEILLANQLLIGALPSVTYRREMAALAAQDALRHPVVLPPEHGT